MIFAAPWVLLALPALPLLWWLLRVTPPAPRRIAFPALRLLRDLPVEGDIQRLLKDVEAVALLQDPQGDRDGVRARERQEPLETRHVLPARARVAQALVEVEMDARFRDLIEQLAARAPAEDVTDADIDREVQAVRNAARPA